MLLSSSISVFLERFKPEKAVEILSEAGFDAIDFSFPYRDQYYDETTDSEEFKQSFLRLRGLAEEKGMCFNQAHSPMPSSTPDPAVTERMFNAQVRAMRNASYLGIETMIVHPMQHLTFSEDGVPEKLFELNMDFYNRLKPYCEEYNMKIAVENMWQNNGAKILHSTCSRPEEFIKYVDELDSEWFVACLDIGHAYLICEEPKDFIRKLGSKRLKALHVHDVDGIHDLHTLPYYGSINWDDTMASLKEIGYDGDFTYEANNFLRVLPDELLLSGARHMAETGRYLMNKMK